MRVVRVSDIEEEQKKALAPPVVARPRPIQPQPQPQQPQPQPYVQETTADWEKLPERDYEERYQRRLDRILRTRELELIGVTPKQPKQVSITPMAPVDRKTELVKVAHQMKEEYQALGEAATILNEFSKPNPWELFMNSEMAKGIGQVIGQTAVGVMNNVAQQQMEKRQLAVIKKQQMLQQQQTQPNPQPQPQQQVVQQQPQVNIQNQPEPQMQEQPPQDVNLKLDPNDKKLMEVMQMSNIKIAENLAAVVAKMEALNQRIDGLEKKPENPPVVLPPLAPNPHIPPPQPPKVNELKPVPKPLAETMVPAKDEVREGSDDLFGEVEQLEEEDKREVEDKKKKKGG